MLFTNWATDVIAPARSPEGRSHYNGQAALYLSETHQGCIIATARYIGNDDAPRALYPLHVQSGQIIEMVFRRGM